MNRREFLIGAAAVVAGGCRMVGNRPVVVVKRDYAEIQKEIDLVKGADFREYLASGEVRFAAIARLEDVFDRVLAEVKSTEVAERPAVWFLYNMGIIVKTKEACFSVDLMHRRASEMAPLLDFALITHNHGDHYTREFYQLMDNSHKTVINNFECNYGANRKGGIGGYTREKKTFRLKDVEIKTSLSDHNNYLVDFTTAFEIKIGDFRIFHSGDSSNVAKLKPEKAPDLWLVHPRCGLKVADGVRKFAPKTTVIAHLNELGHDQWRWTWQDGLKEMCEAEAAGEGRAIVPLWGDRIV